MQFCTILYSLCNSPGSLGGCRSVCSPCISLILLIFTEFAAGHSLPWVMEWSSMGMEWIPLVANSLEMVALTSYKCSKIAGNSV